MADYNYTSQQPVTTDSDFITHSLAIEYTVSANCDAIGGRAWVPSGGRPPTFFWQLWQVSSWTLLAEVDLNHASFGTPASSAWMNFASAAFLTPGNVAQAPATAYAAGVFCDDGQFVFTEPGSYPLTNGLLTTSTGRFRTGGLRTDPPVNTFNAFYFANVLVSGQSQVTLTPAAVSVAAQPVNPAPGQVVVNLTPAVAALAAVPLTVPNRRGPMLISTRDRGAITVSRSPHSYL